LRHIDPANYLQISVKISPEFASPPGNTSTPVYRACLEMARCKRAWTPAFYASM
jgi:hypothetical protein